MSRTPQERTCRISTRHTRRLDDTLSPVAHTSEEYAEDPVGTNLPPTLQRDEFSDRQLLYLDDWYSEHRRTMLTHMLDIALTMPLGCEVSPRRVGLNVLLLAAALGELSHGEKLGSVKTLVHRFSVRKETVYEQLHAILDKLRVHYNILGGDASKLRKH